MFRSHNRKVRLMLDGPGYELFWIAENAEHVITRANHHSHQISLLEAERLAEIAYFIHKGDYNARMQYQKVIGVAIFRNKTYQIIAYLTDFPTRRCILETCHVVNDNKILDWARRNPLLIKTLPHDGR